MKINTVSEIEINFVNYPHYTFPLCNTEQLGLIKDLNETTWSYYHIKTLQVSSKLTVLFSYSWIIKVVVLLNVVKKHTMCYYQHHIFFPVLV